MNIAESYIAHHPEWNGATVLSIQNVVEFCNSLVKRKDEAKRFFSNLWDLPCRPPWPKVIAWFRLPDAWKTLADGEFGFPCCSDEQKMGIQFLVTQRGQECTFASIALPLDSQGCPDREQNAEARYANENLSIDNKEERQEILLRLTEFFLAAMSFCHCRNVRIEKVPISRQVRRHAERKGEPIIEHHHLVIEPMRQVLIKEGGLHEHGDLARAMHICRGHFVHYGEKFGKGKLFGKYEGQFWLPQHVRGSLDKGVITKDYAISLPKQ